VCRDSVVQGAVVRGVGRLQRVFDVVLQLTSLQYVGHESGCELAWSAAGAGRAAVVVELVSVAKEKEREGCGCTKGAPSGSTGV